MKHESLSRDWHFKSVKTYSMTGPVDIKLSISSAINADAPFAMVIRTIE